jgi:hypothetical protein
MEIKRIRRPWEKPGTYGKRYNPDPFYQSQEWKRTKTSFKQGTTKANDGIDLSNKYCIDCYNEDRKFVLMHTVDHHVPIKEGGHRTDHSNLRSQCESHHAKKSAEEGNRRRNKPL